jgi:hypothetical protein
VPGEADCDPADAGPLDEPIEGAGEAHRVDHAAMLGGEDQVMVRLLRPVLTGDLPLQLLQLPPLFQGAGADSRSGSTACEDSVLRSLRTRPTPFTATRRVGRRQKGWELG